MKNFIIFLIFVQILTIFTACEVSDRSEEISMAFDKEECESNGNYFWDNSCHSIAVCDLQNITPCKDRDTGYIWSSLARNDMDWNSAISYCNNLTEGGYSDWSLPPKDVLLNFYDTKTYHDNPRNKLGDTGFFWSSTEYDSSEAYYVRYNYYGSGPYDSYNYKSNSNSVRCFR